MNSSSRKKILSIAILVFMVIALAVAVSFISRSGKNPEGASTQEQDAVRSELAKPLPDLTETETKDVRSELNKQVQIAPSDATVNSKGETVLSEEAKARIREELRKQ